MSQSSDQLFPEALIARIVGRRGRLHLTRAIDPRHTALAVIDMQIAFTAAAQPSETPSARAIIPAINRLSRALRDGGRPRRVQPGHVQRRARRRLAGLLPTYGRSADRGADRRRAAARRAGARTRSGARRFAGDLVFPKCRYSAFARDASPLEPWLVARGVKTLIVAGTITNVCCESTARDAMQLGYDTIMAADANAARDQQAHDARRSRPSSSSSATC